MQRGGHLVPRGLGVAEMAGSRSLCRRRNLLQVSVSPPPRLGISVGIYDLSPRSWWGGDLSVSISAALCVNLRQGFTQQTALVEILTREERGGIFAASALWVVKVKEQ